MSKRQRFPPTSRPHHMALMLSDKELAVLQLLASEQGMSQSAVLRQALREYQTRQQPPPPMGPMLRNKVLFQGKSAMSEERIACVAIRMIDGKLFWLERPKRHHDVIRKLATDGHEVSEIATATQGFITDHGRFVDRTEAKRIATESAQIIPRRGQHMMLFSEDLW
jgi:hypothetical protein